LNKNTASKKDNHRWRMYNALAENLLQKIRKEGVDARRIRSDKK
jgi:hypothetical protein